MYFVENDSIIVVIDRRLIRLDKSKESFDIVHELFPNGDILISEGGTL